VLTPVIAAEAAHLTVFQRTPNYSIPARNAPLTAEEIAEIKANYREIRQLSRETPFGFPFTPAERLAYDVSAEERRAIYRELWEQGGFRFLFCSFGDLIIDKAANDTAAEFIRAKIRQIVKDPAVAEMLVPTDHPYGTKRRLSLLRDLQPRQRHPRGPAPDADRGDHARGPENDRRRVRPRHHRVRNMSPGDHQQEACVTNHKQ
jgi:cation diffusion facilitator CzcD-associated flavoprotein CzcO